MHTYVAASENLQETLSPCDRMFLCSCVFCNTVRSDGLPPLSLRGAWLRPLRLVSYFRGDVTSRIDHSERRAAECCMYGPRKQPTKAEPNQAHPISGSEQHLLRLMASTGSTRYEQHIQTECVSCQCPGGLAGISLIGCCRMSWQNILIQLTAASPAVKQSSSRFSACRHGSTSVQAADLFADTQAVQDFCSVLAHRMFHTTGRGHESNQCSTSAGDPSGATGNLSSQKLENGQVRAYSFKASWVGH